VLFSNINFVFSRRWRPNPDHDYSVHGVYQLLTTQQHVTLDAAEDLIWHRQVPLKVSIFVWRLLRDRLPTKTNLVTRGIITQNSHFCMASCGGIESTQHLFLFMQYVWYPLALRSGFSAVEYSNIFRVTVFGSPFQQVVVEGCDLFNNLVGCHVCGLYGTREIRNYS
jgi:hypothetical protein